MNKPHIPDRETRKRLLQNLRQTHLEMAQFNLEMAEINAQLEHQNRQQKLRRLQQSQLLYQSGD